MEGGFKIFRNPHRQEIDMEEIARVVKVHWRLMNGLIRKRSKLYQRTKKRIYKTSYEVRRKHMEISSRYIHQEVREDTVE